MNVPNEQGWMSGKYVVSRFWRNEEYSLQGDRLIITAHGLVGAHYSIPYRLADLDPNPFEMKTRDQRVTAAIGLTIVLGLFPFAWILAQVVHLPPEALVPGIFLWLLGGMGLSLLHPFRIHSFAFRHTSGLTAFTIPKAGRRKRERDAFVALLSRAIEEIAVQGESPRSTGPVG